MTQQHDLTWGDLFAIAAPVSVEMVNAASCFHENESIQALALIGAGVALSKASGQVSRDEFMTACALMWEHQEAVFETVEVRAN